ncbi:MAG: carbon-nitrogen hydrolase [Chloroflexi bacterium]|nr:carbon-nitrogen hydrolase [Chloroflexota bacterium]
MTTLTASLAQMYPKFGDIDYNLATHLKLIEEAAQKGADLIVFPELSLTGYYLRDLVHEVAMTPDSPPLQKLRTASREHNIDVMVGFVDTSARHNFHIAAAYLSQGDVVHVHHKVYLPTYAIFDDGRFFAPGEHIRAFDTRFGRLGMLICEDFWHISASYVLWLDGADILLTHSASPARGLTDEASMETQRWVNHFMQTFGTLYSTFIVHCNRVGFEDGEVFWGGSSVIDPNGAFLLQAPNFEEKLLFQELDLNEIRRTRIRTQLLRDEQVGLTAREIARIAQKDPTKSP